MNEHSKIEQSDTRREALRAELVAARLRFHHLVDTAVASGWQQKSSSSSWTIRELLIHLTWALEYLPEEVRRARRGKGMFNMPRGLSDTLSYWYMRWLARAAAPTEICRRYDRAIEAAVAMLATIPEDDWSKGANFYGEGFHSVEDLFHVPAQHLAEHAVGINGGEEWQ